MVRPLRGPESDIVTGDEERAELLNSYFSSVFSCKWNHAQHGKITSCDERWELWPRITVGLVHKHIVSLHETKSSGPDELLPRVLKELADVISEPLSIIFDKSWKTGEVPEDWK